MPHHYLRVAVLVVGLLPACKHTDPLYCDSNTPCTDPDRPFCDDNGEYPASDGIKHTCIPDPFSGDAGPGGDASGPRRVVQLAVGLGHSCAVLNDGALRCWGSGKQLGYPSIEDIGDNEHPFEAGDVPTGGRVKQVALGDQFTCALYEEGNVRCWGLGQFGSLGYGDTMNRYGPDYTPDKLSDVELNGKATQLVTGLGNTCALLETKEVRCWGYNMDYQLATGDTEPIGDGEVPGSRSPVEIGKPVIALSARGGHTCAVVEGDFVRCWGTCFGGPIGYGAEMVVGDDETPADMGDINVGGRVSQVAVGSDHSCVLLEGGTVRCWGSGEKTGLQFGTLGYQETEDIGDDESPASAGDLPLGGVVEQLAGGAITRCALMSGGAVRCWGDIYTNESFSEWNSVLGQGEIERIGDNESPDEVPPIDLGEPAVLLADQYSIHQCALLESGAVRCWGLNSQGQLGLGHTESIGDDELPATEASVRILE